MQPVHSNHCSPPTVTTSAHNTAPKALAHDGAGISTPRKLSSNAQSKFSPPAQLSSCHRGQHKLLSAPHQSGHAIDTTAQKQLASTQHARTHQPRSLVLPPVRRYHHAPDASQPLNHHPDTTRHHTLLAFLVPQAPPTAPHTSSDPRTWRARQYRLFVVVVAVVSCQLDRGVFLGRRRIGMVRFGLLQACDSGTGAGARFEPLRA